MTTQTAHGNTLRPVTPTFTVLESASGETLGFVNQAGIGCYRSMLAASNPKFLGTRAPICEYATLDDAVAALEAVE